MDLQFLGKRAKSSDESPYENAHTKMGPVAVARGLAYQGFRTSVLPFDEAIGDAPDTMPDVAQSMLPFPDPGWKRAQAAPDVLAVREQRAQDSKAVTKRVPRTFPR
jgi:hypothetical protein